MFVYGFATTKANAITKLGEWNPGAELLSVEYRPSGKPWGYYLATGWKDDPRPILKADPPGEIGVSDAIESLTKLFGDLPILTERGEACPTP